MPVLQDGDIFKTTIPLSEIADKPADKISEIADNTADKKHNRSHQDKIIDYLKTNITCKNNKSLQSELNLSDRQTREVLSKMAKYGLIVAEGGNRNRSYRLK
ncbi:MAG: hypothetical protein R3Y35_12530 [Clostridia bacterium]